MRQMRVLVCLMFAGSALKAQNPTAKCQDAYQAGTAQYDDWKDREVTDVSNFKRATKLFQKALKECRGGALDSASWVSLANASFLGEEWTTAAGAICKATTPLHQNLCAIFKECRRDRDFETLRRASIHELHGNLRGAQELYKKVSTTKCQGLAKHGQAEAERVAKILETPPSL